MHLTSHPISSSSSRHKIQQIAFDRSQCTRSLSICPRPSNLSSLLTNAIFSIPDWLAAALNLTLLFEQPREGLLQNIHVISNAEEEERSQVNGTCCCLRKASTLSIPMIAIIWRCQLSFYSSCWMELRYRGETNWNARERRKYRNRSKVAFELERSQLDRPLFTWKVIKCNQVVEQD